LVRKKARWRAALAIGAIVFGSGILALSIGVEVEHPPTDLVEAIAPLVAFGGLLGIAGREIAALRKDPIRLKGVIISKKRFRNPDHEETTGLSYRALRRFGLIIDITHAETLKKDGAAIPDTQQLGHQSLYTTKRIFNSHETDLNAEVVLLCTGAGFVVAVVESLPKQTAGDGTQPC
jgi:hypothetical protein